MKTAMKTAIKTIIVPIGLSAKCENALHLATQMAKRHDAKLILVHVVPLQHIIDKTGRQVIGADTAQLTIETAGEKLLNYKKLLIEENTNLSVETVVKTGFVLEAVNEVVISENADLVVMGTSGEQKWKQLILGSYSYNLLIEVRCSVLLVPQTFTKSEFSNILFPVRVTDFLDMKIELAMSIAEKNNAHINLYGVCDENNLSEIKQEFLAMENKLRDKVQSFQSELVMTSDNAEAISEESKNRNCDLVILSHKDEFLWKSLFLENFFRKIINNTDATLLFVKPKLAESVNTEDYNTQYDLTMPVPG